MKIAKADSKGIALAIKYLRAGKAVVYPTETAYGLGVDATNANAVKRLYRIKERTRKQPIHIIVHKQAAVEKLAIVNSAARKLMKKFWPGPLTIVLPIKNSSQPPLWKRGGDTPSLLQREGRGEFRTLRILSAGTGTIGLRMPSNRIALALTKKLGRPITATSANPAGGPAPYAIEDSLRQFQGKKYQPDLYLDAGKLPKRSPSTIVRVKHGIIQMLRKGPVTLKQIRKFV